jgi:hypothetical protein
MGQITFSDVVEKTESGDGATERRSISYGAPSSRQVLLLVSVLALRQTEPLGGSGEQNN